MKKIYLFWLILFSLHILDANATTTAVSASSRMNKYLGKWYEIARLPNRFERTCTPPIITDYRLNPQDNNQLLVTTQCKTITRRQKTKTVIADFVGIYDNDHLKASTWSELLGWVPFVHNNYWLYPLDHEQVTMVASDDHQYLWILARRENINMDILEEAIKLAQKNGFDTKELIFNYPLVWQK